jgi:VWFA-related protein
MRIPSYVLALPLLALVVVGVRATQTQQPPVPVRADKADTASVTAVVVDVVVRDRKEQPVTDLAEADFEVFEDGTKQQIGSFRVVSREPGGVYSGSAPAAAKPSAPAAAPAPPKPADPAVIALVFDRLTPDGRTLTHKAALRYVGDQPQSPNVLGVFSIDLGLEVLQGFTRETATVRKALATLASRGSTTFGADTARVRALRQQALSASTPTATAGGTGPAAAASGAAAGAASVEQLSRDMERRMLEGIDLLEREQQGYSSLNGLHAVVSAMKLVPGRKTIIFFSEGLSIPTNIEARFRSIIDEANRANVAVYTMDAAGLRATSTQAEVRDEVNRYGAGALAGGSGGAGAAGTGTRSMEEQENLMRLDPSSGLGQLSRETGGFNIQGSNDLNVGFRRIDEDIRNHYILTYVSTNPAYDGKFRKIEVKVQRTDVSVAARKGYFAVRPTDGVPILSYEAPALAILDGGKPPNAFPIRSRAFVFPEAPDRTRVPVLVGLQANQLDFKADTTRNTFSAEAVIVVRVRDANGQVIAKMSQPYTFAEGIERMDGAKRAEILFFRQPIVAPGAYTLETIVYDAQAQKASVRLSSLDVPASTTDQLRVSTPFVVRRAEKVPEKERDATNPLYFGEMLLYPNLGEPLSKAGEKELSFAFSAWPGKSGVTQATLALLRGGAEVATLPLPLDKPDASGRIQQVGRLPLAPIPPGSYELRVTLEGGGEKVSRSVPFSIVAG